MTQYIVLVRDCPFHPGSTYSAHKMDSSHNFSESHEKICFIRDLLAYFSKSCKRTDRLGLEVLGTKVNPLASTDISTGVNFKD